MSRGLAKTGVISGIALIAKTLSMLILNKVLATTIGPAGYGLLGQFQNFSTVINSLVGAGTANGVVRYTAENISESGQAMNVWASALRISAGLFLICATVLVIFPKDIEKAFLSEIGFPGWWLLCLVGAAFYAGSTLLLSVLNGYGEISRHAGSTAVGALLGSLLIGLLTLRWGLVGAVVGVSIGQVVLFIVTIAFYRGFKRFDWSFLGRSFDWVSTKRLLSYSAMALTSAVSQPVASLFIRKSVASQFGMDAAGLWEGLNRISSTYLMMVTTPASIYLLPKLAKATDRRLQETELRNVYRLMVPLVLFCAGGIYLARTEVVRLLFSSEFSGVEDLLGPQLLGDFFRAVSWPLAYLMVIHGRTSLYIGTEIAFSLLYVTTARWGMASIGVSGPQLAYALSYLIYLVSFVVFSRSERMWRPQ